MEMYQAMEQSCDELSDPKEYERQYNIFRTRQNEMKEQIHLQFKEFAKSLRALEMKVIDGLYGNYQPFEDKFNQARKFNSKMMNEAQGWMDKAKHQLDEYTTKTAEDPQYLAFDMIDSKHECLADEVLSQGENLFEKVERQKGFPSLNGLESQYKQVRLWYESPASFEKKIGAIAKVLGPGQNEPTSTDVTTVSGSFLPPFSLNEIMTEDDSQQKTNNNRVDESALNLSNISFDDP